MKLCQPQLAGGGGNQRDSFTQYLDWTDSCAEFWQLTSLICRMPVRAAAAICGAVVRHSFNQSRCPGGFKACSLLRLPFCFLFFLFFFLPCSALLFSSPFAFFCSCCFAPAVGSGALPAGVELLVLTFGLLISSDSCSQWSHTYVCLLTYLRYT